MELLRIYVHDFVDKTFRFGISIDRLTGPNQHDIWHDQEHRTNLLSTLRELSAVCEVGELPVTKIKADYVISCLTQYDDPNNADGKKIANLFNNQVLAHHLHEIRDRFKDELSTKLFFQLPHTRKALFDTPLQGWEEVVSRFPETQSEISEMSRCFSLSRYPASIFHATQVIEAGLIHLGAFLEIKDPKSGWTAVCNELKRIVLRTRFEELKEHEKRHFSFLEQVQGTAESLNSAWRNKISHAMNRLILLPGDSSPDVAEEIRVAARSFMRRLATELPKGKISDQQEKI